MVSVIMLSVIMVSVIMVNVIMVNVIMLSAIMLSVIMLSVVMLTVALLYNYAVIMLSIVMLSVALLYYYAECHYTDRRNAVLTTLKGGQFSEMLFDQKFWHHHHSFFQIGITSWKERLSIGKIFTWFQSYKTFFVHNLRIFVIS